jgi:hypothetical protein
VKDADTKQPIPGAEVSVSFPLADSYLAPSATSSTTDENGLARLSVAPYGDASIFLAVNTKGYVRESRFLPVLTIRDIEPDHWFKSVQRKTPTLTVELYASEPSPTVELVLPSGYRGPVQVEMRIAEDAPSVPGQRRFSYPVSASGDALITGPAVFRYFPLPDFSAKYADGMPLPRNPQGAQIGLWWQNSSGNIHHFLIGTASEFAASQPTPATEGGRHSSGSAKGQGRGGRRGRMGNGSSGDLSIDGNSP